jgi:tetratricopeptide (TPR) repeat protein
VRRLGALLERVDEVPPLLRARALRVYGSSVQTLGHPDAVDAFERSLAAYRAIGDERGTAIILHRLAVAAWSRGDREEARALAEESLAGHRRCGYVKGELQPLGLLGHLEWEDGRRERALELTQESVRLAHQVGFRWWEAGGYVILARYAVELGRFADAEQWARDSLALAGAIGDRVRSVHALEALAAALAAQARWDEAGRIWGAVEAEMERNAIPGWLEEQAELSPSFAGGGVTFEEARMEARTLSFDDVVTSAAAG